MYTVQNGDTLSGIAKKYGVSLQSLQSGNSNIADPNKINVGQQISISGTQPAQGAGSGVQPQVQQQIKATNSYASNMPTSYSQLMTPDQIMGYANNQAQSRYDNQALGYNQQIDQYNQKAGQLQSNADIQKQAQQLYSQKYADTLRQILDQEDDAKLQAGQDKTDQTNALNDGTKSMQSNSFLQKSAALESMASRGLNYSTLQDGRMNSIDRATTSAIGTLNKAYADNVAKIDSQLNNLVTQLERQYTSTSQAQRTETVAKIEELTKERDNQKSQYDLAIQQLNQQITQAASDKTSYADSLYQELYGTNQAAWQKQQDAAEQKREFDQQLQLQRAELAQRASEASAKADAIPKAVGGTHAGATLQDYSDGVITYGQAKKELDYKLASGAINQTSYDGALAWLSSEEAKANSAKKPAAPKKTTTTKPSSSSNFGENLSKTLNAVKSVSNVGRGVMNSALKSAWKNINF